MADKEPRSLRPFWLHQAVEYLIGIVLISAAFQSVDPAPLAVLGIVVLLNAAIVAGPLAAFRGVSKRVHRVLDIALVALLVAAAVQPWISIDGTSRVVCAAIAVVLGTVWFHTDWADRAGRKARRAAAAGPRGEEFGRRAGRMVGEGYKAAKRMRDRP